MRESERVKAVEEEIKHGHGEHEQPSKRQGLQMAATGGVSRVPAQQVLPAGHRVQVRTSTGQRGGAERPSDRLLR